MKAIHVYVILLMYFTKLVQGVNLKDYLLLEVC